MKSLSDAERVPKTGPDSLRQGKWEIISSRTRKLKGCIVTAYPYMAFLPFDQVLNPTSAIREAPILAAEEPTRVCPSYPVNCADIRLRYNPCFQLGYPIPDSARFWSLRLL